MSQGGRRNFVTAYLYVALSQGTLFLGPLVIIPVITRMMGKEAFGIWRQVLITSMLLGPALTFRIMTTLSRYLAGTRNGRDFSRSYLFSTMMVLGGTLVVFAGCLLWTRPAAQLLFGDPELGRFVWPTVTYAGGQALMQILLSYFYTSGRHVAYSIVRSIIPVATCGLIFFAARYNDIALCVYVVSGLMALTGLSILVYIILKHGWARPSISGFPGIWKFSAWMVLNHWLVFIAIEGGRYVVVGLLGLASIAIYSLTLQIAGLLTMIGMPGDFALLPMMSAHWNDNEPEKARSLLRLAYLILAVLGFPAIAVLQQMGGILTSLLSTKDFVMPAHVSLFLQIGVLAGCFRRFSQMAFAMTHRFVRFQIVCGVAVIISIGAPFLLIPKLGLFGAAISYGLTSVFVGALGYRLSVDIMGVRMDWRRTGKALVLGLLVYLCLEPIHWLPLGGVWKIIIGLFITLAAMAVGFLLLRFCSIDQLRGYLKKAPEEIEQ